MCFLKKPFLEILLIHTTFKINRFIQKFESNVLGKKFFPIFSTYWFEDRKYNKKAKIKILKFYSNLQANAN